MGAMGSGVVGGRELPSLALAARSTVEGRPYGAFLFGGSVLGFGVLGDRPGWSRYMQKKVMVSKR
ncbi:hypothetical protein KDH_24910 [Dictyobacter sp. S3.2.2.5]|uniref:Uncharacterized protein n=1 Tax=Dictyobacter halimunensis TaxID=3026934 RepID=A0ABQ6FPL2_9CHLR|nr:hypothetical protein KDH_24910 [Dictyobacter sp. S3.2.2.5]